MGEQPFQILVILLERPGEMVSREQLRAKLWAQDTFVDFDHGLNSAVQRLRDCLSDSAGKPRWVETLPRRGYRFVGQVEWSDLSSKTLPKPSSERQDEGPDGETQPSVRVGPAQVPARASSVSRRIALLIVVALVLFLAAVPIVKRIREARSANQALRIKSLAVLPLENLSGDPAQEYFADGMTDELITELARIPNLRVVSRTSVMQNKGKNKSLQQIARELNVDAIVEGSVVRSGDKVRITAQLIDARDDRHLWAQSFEGQMSDILSLQDSVAAEIAAQAKVMLTPASRSDKRSVASIEPAAHDAYLRGRYFLNKRDAGRSATYFQQAISIDPAYASAYAGLANALSSQSALEMATPEDVMPKATAAAKRAIELDPENGEAYTVLGFIETSYEWDWAAAERDLTKGIELSPNDSLAEIHFVAYLDAMNRPEEAVTHMRRALLLDPLSFFMTRHLGSALFFARHYDEALYYLRRAQEMEPSVPGVVDNWISWINEKKGMQEEAVHYDLAAMGSSVSQAERDKLLHTFQRSGWKAYWQAHIEQMSTEKESCAPYDVGVSYLRLGERGQAFLWLNKALERKCLWAIWLKVDPMVDDARTDPRYRVLLQKMNLAN